MSAAYSLGSIYYTAEIRVDDAHRKLDELEARIARVNQAAGAVGSANASVSNVSGAGGSASGAVALASPASYSPMSSAATITPGAVAAQGQALDWGAASPNWSYLMSQQADQIVNGLAPQASPNWSYLMNRGRGIGGGNRTTPAMTLPAWTGLNPSQRAFGFVRPIHGIAIGVGGLAAYGHEYSREVAEEHFQNWNTPEASFEKELSFRRERQGIESEFGDWMSGASGGWSNIGFGGSAQKRSGLKAFLLGGDPSSGYGLTSLGWGPQSSEDYLDGLERLNISKESGLAGEKDIGSARAARRIAGVAGATGRASREAEYNIKSVDVSEKYDREIRDIAGSKLSPNEITLRTLTATTAENAELDAIREAKKKTLADYDFGVNASIGSAITDAAFARGSIGGESRSAKQAYAVNQFIDTIAQATGNQNLDQNQRNAIINSAQAQKDLSIDQLQREGVMSKFNYATTTQASYQRAQNNPLGATLTEVMGAGVNSIIGADQADRAEATLAANAKIIEVVTKYGREFMNTLQASGNENAVLSAELARDPVGAIHARAKADRDAAQASFGPLFNVPILGGMLKNSIISGIDLREQLGEEDFDFNAGQMQRRLNTQRAGLQARLNRNPFGAEALEAAGSAIGDAEELKRGGMRGAASTALNNALLSEDLLKQTYYDHIRGVQEDVRLMSNDNPRDTEDVQKFVDAVKTAKDEIVAAIKDLAAN